MSAAASDSKGLQIGQYQLGKLLGKGGFGKVFKARNNNTGGVVALKQIPYAKVAGADLQSIKCEIDLLSALENRHVVKYYEHFDHNGFFYIVMECVEQGSLLDVLQNFGNIPEHLVAKYVSEVLQGLSFLHSEGVIHRDIKAANILITQKGRVKLADFGVAAKLNDVEADAVAGTPYWMAPEIIQLNPPQFTSDIWAVGCTVVELLTGTPPYFNLIPMQALFRIVQDPYPPLPEDISNELRQFLRDCFTKDPAERPTAQQLLNHRWLKEAFRSSAREEECEENHARDMDEVKHHQRGFHLLEQAPRVSLPRSKEAEEKLQQFAESEENVDEFDEFLDFGMVVSPTVQGRKLSSPRINTPKSGSSGSSAGSHQRTSSTKNPLGPDMDSDSDSSEDWFDEDDPGDFPAGPPLLVNPFAKELRLGDAPKLAAPLSKPSTSGDGMSAHQRKKSVDFSLPKSQQRTADASEKVNTLQGKVDSGSSSGSNPGYSLSTASSRGSALFSMFGQAMENQSSSALSKYREGEEEEDDDFLEGALPLTMGRHVLARPSAQEDPLSSDSDSDWDEEDEGGDSSSKSTGRPFSQFEEQIMEQIPKLNLEASSDKIRDACSILTSIFKQFPAEKYLLTTKGGIVPLLDLLELEDLSVVEAVFCLINELMVGYDDFVVNMCVTGGIPMLMQFCHRRYPRSLRRQASRFVKELCSRKQLIPLLVSCGGFKWLVSMLDHTSHDFDENKELIFSGVTLIRQVYDAAPRFKRDYTRLLVKAGLLEKISEALKNTIHLMDVTTSPVQVEQLLKQSEMIISMVEAVSQFDEYIKLKFKGEVLRIFHGLIRKLNKKLRMAMLRIVKNVSDGFIMGEDLAMFIPDLVEHLPPISSSGRDHDPETMRTRVVLTQALFNICRFDVKRSESAYLHGVLPHLMHFTERFSNSGLCTLSMTLICEQAQYQSREIYRHLWKEGGVGFFLRVSSEQETWVDNILKCLSRWLKAETKRLEQELCKTESVEVLCDIFERARTNFFNLLESFSAILQDSSRLACTLSESPFVTTLLQRLNMSEAVRRGYEESNKLSYICRHLLQMLLELYKSSPNPQEFISKHYDIHEILDTILSFENAGKLSHQIAGQLKKDFAAGCRWHI